MYGNEGGTLSAAPKVPNQEKETSKTSTNTHCSAKHATCKLFDQTIFKRYDREGVEAQLQAYINLGLTPIPLRGKRPIVKWRHGWNPTKLDDLKPYIGRAVNWGLKTGDNFAVVDFDSQEAFTRFIAANIEYLSSDMPIVRTGRGYHLWFKPTKPLRNAHFEGVDIIAEGGQAVSPPSIHPSTHKRYKFIRPPKGPLPQLDITKLTFPDLKKREGVVRDGAVIRKFEQGGGGEGPRFDPESIKNGVGEGCRHSTLVSFIGHLVSRAKSLQEIYDEALYWNEHNKPPMEEAEVIATVDDCWQRYAAKHGNKNVPIKTLNKSTSVIVGTRPYPRISRRQRLYQPESPHPVPEPENLWEPEDDRQYVPTDCGKKRSIIRRGREFMSVSFFCGRWDCPHCGSYFRQRWIEHIIEKTKGIELYTTEISAGDWARVRRAINRSEANYMRIKVGGVYKVMTDKPLKDSSRLEQGEVKAFLEATIPLTTTKCPISTSRDWQRGEKKEKSDYQAVAITWLPVKEQIEVAESLGAKTTKYARWLSPEDVGEEEWAERFKQTLKERERLVSWWLNHPTYRMDMQDYLNQQYIEDAVDDEYGYEGII